MYERALSKSNAMILASAIVLLHSSLASVVSVKPQKNRESIQYNSTTVHLIFVTCFLRITRPMNENFDSTKLSDMQYTKGYLCRPSGAKHQHDHATMFNLHYYATELLERSYN